MTKEDQTTQEQRRGGVERAAANLALSGYVPSAEQLERQERYIRGEITIEQAIQEIKDSIPNLEGQAGCHLEGEIASSEDKLASPTQREKNIESLNSDQTLKGQHPSTAELEHQARFISGEVSIEELMKEMLQRAFEIMDTSANRERQFTPEERE